jgi:hypothetical protein
MNLGDCESGRTVHTEWLSWLYRKAGGRHTLKVKAGLEARPVKTLVVLQCRKCIRSTSVLVGDVVFAGA